MGIKLGNLDINSFKVGGADCSIYLGDTKLYPSAEPTPTPTPTYEWKQYNVGYTFPPPAESKLYYGIKFGYPNTSNIENANITFYSEGENIIAIVFNFDTETSKWISAYVINDGEPVYIDLSKYYNETEECYVIYFSDFGDLGLGAMLVIAPGPDEILEYGPIQLYEEVTPTSN